ncbi:hypothetical protein KV697_11155 [Sphingomonas sanguinis]|uniref:hypothetical protein n=1 Tax=Sphingomonas sanguinis TaxID=33051 RepID=UPI001C5838D8|nr:hypothetical protein [Sphingomonas sanguinis]QXT34384.1 hypothetical protein KV697_11155 [Sphingomonas sanguinis]
MILYELILEICLSKIASILDNVMIGHASLLFNLAVQNSNVRAAARFASLISSSFCAESFIGALSKIERFPFVTIGEMVVALNTAGAGIAASKATPTELYEIAEPALVYVRRRRDQPHSTDLMEFKDHNVNFVEVIDFNHDNFTISKIFFEEIYEGIVLHKTEDKISGHSDDLRQVPQPFSTHPFLSKAECFRLRQFCNGQKFYDIPKNKFLQHCIFNPVQKSFGLSADIDGSTPGIVQDVIKAAANILNVKPLEIEGIHVRKMLVSDVVPARFDNGVNLQRVRSLHFSFGDAGSVFNFKDTCYGRSIPLLGGQAIIIRSGDDSGRTDWRSSWAGEAAQGVCYLGSCWQRLPLS